MADSGLTVDDVGQAKSLSSNVFDTAVSLQSQASRYVLYDMAFDSSRGRDLPNRRSKFWDSVHDKGSADSAHESTASVLEGIFDTGSTFDLFSGGSIFNMYVLDHGNTQDFETDGRWVRVPDYIRVLGDLFTDRVFDMAAAMDGGAPSVPLDVHISSES